MKLHILNLEAHEDLASAQDKLAWAQAEHVVLVWPRYGDVLQRRLDLILLDRAARARGRSIAVLSHDPVVRDHARLAGLPLFDSLDDIPESGWRDSSAAAANWQATGEARQKSRPLPKPQIQADPALDWHRPVAIGLAALAVLALSFALLPSATVTVVPEKRSRSGAWTFSLAEPGGTNADDSLNLPTGNTSAVIEVTAETNVTGNRRVPSAHAQGSLRFTNLTDSAVALPAGTSLRTSDRDGSIRFVTAADAVVPAGSVNQIEVPAQAADAGESGNVAAFSITSVDGPLGLAVQVDNPAAFSGGASSLQPVVSEADYRRLSAEAARQLTQAGLETLVRQLPVGLRIVPDSVELRTIESSEFDHQIGEPAAGLRLTVRGEIAALTIAAELAEDQLRASIEPGMTGDWSFVAGSLTFEIEPGQPSANEPDEVTLSAAWQEVHALDASQLRERIRGAAPSRADEVLSAQPGVASVQITPRPAWLPSLPWIGARLQVVVLEAG